MLNDPMMRGHADNKEQNSGNFVRKAGQAITLGTNIAVGVGLFTFLGYYADKKSGGGFLWTLFGMGIGLVYGAYEIWKVIRIINSGDGGDFSQRNEK